ncbi:MAG TPA: winged helix-turn-helix domain-containing protein [Terriglobales bacterium]|nr:winged helix-turn-helix domain-containing protein [Terriglobales bacterium]
MASATRPSSKSGVLGFADFKLDLQSGELHRNGSLVRLQRQPFEVLAHLAENAGEIVSREELRRRLWPSDTFVDFDNGLNATINKVREALGDSADSPRFVETLPRRGYRFIAKVAVIAPHGSAQASAEPVGARNLEIVRRPWRRWLLGAAACAVIMALAVIGWRVRAKPAPLPEVRPEQITTNAAEIPVTGSALSPDGKFLAYSDPTGTHLRVVATGETHTLPVPTGLALHPDAWLPDSATFVATDHVDSRPGEPPSLWTISVVGTPRKLMDNAFSAAVSRDGTRVAFLRNVLNVNTQGGREIWTMSLDGSAPRLLTRAEESEWLGSLTWSPDSRSLAFLRTRDPNHFDEMTSIEVQSVDSGRSITLLRNPKIGNGLWWAADGRILYTLQESTTWGSAFENWASTFCSVWALPITSNGEPKGTPVRIASASGEVSRFSMSESTGMLAFVNEVKQTDVYLSELEPNAKGASSPHRLTLSDSNDVPLAWTPDSRSVIFISDRSGYVNIYRQAIDQATPELIVGGRVNSWTPRVTPDGRHLVYLEMPDAAAAHQATGESGLPVRIMEVPLAGGMPRHVLTGPDFGNLNCSQTGGCFFSKGPAAGSGPGTELFSLDLSTGATKRILELKGDSAHCCAWTLSPDGQTLAVGGPVKNGTLRLISLPSMATQELVIADWSRLGSSLEPVSGGFDWAADGKGLFLSADIQPSGLALLYVDLQGHARVLLKGGNIRWAIPSPDGRYLALHTFSTVRNVWFAILDCRRGP